MRVPYHIAILLLLPVLLQSCGPPNWFNKKYNAARIYKLVPADSRHNREEVQVEKNYDLGLIRTAQVGEPIIRRRAHMVKIRGRMMATPVVNTVLSSDTISVHLRRGQLYPVKFDTNWDGEPFRVIEVPHPHGRKEPLGIMVRDNGTLNDRIMRGDREYPRIFSITPMNAVMEITYQEELASRKKIEDYEIVYGGIENGEIKLYQHDNTRSDMVKALMAQELSYPLGASLIRNKALTLKIHNVDSNSIACEVLED